MKKLIFWTLAVFVTLAAVIYQRTTGPTKPINVEYSSSDNKKIELELPRSYETPIKSGVEFDSQNIQTIELKVNVSKFDTTLKAFLYYKRYPSADTLKTVVGKYNGDVLTFTVKAEPPAAKIEYFIDLADYNEVYNRSNQNENVVLRFKNSVPAWILIPHILLMFIAMLFANYAGLRAIFKSEISKRYALRVVYALFLGGLVFGPLVQKYAFGEWWTGWPLGYDLTDNKTLLMFLLWLVAWLLNRKKTRYFIIVIVSLLTLLIYSIPHSSIGSQYNYDTNQIESK